MKEYIVNSTFIAYMLDMGERMLFEYVETIPEVRDELKFLRSQTDIQIEVLKIKDADILKSDILQYLSDVDLYLLKTAKSLNKTLITDDKKLAKAANMNVVKVLNTPRLITNLAFKGFIKYEKAMDLLNELLFFYNRKQAVKKAIKDLNEWR